MIMRLFKTLILMLVMGLSLQVSAQSTDATATTEKEIAVNADTATEETAEEEEEDEPKLTFSGSVDTYFRTNLNGPNDISKSGIVAPATSFANLPGFSLGMINLIAANFNYSTSYMFSYGPFSHTGLKLDISSESGFSFMAAILNPTDITEFNPSGDYFFGVQAGYGGFYLNGLFGDGYSQVDLTGGV
ncbi:outer membrane beta-barrel protein, partial [Okeania hirsuta]|uniref:outer membrane beta-barrel protein n=1 Tax=Okeania hirsuta TaxID=1458930 RepID=UPI001960F506